MAKPLKIVLIVLGTVLALFVGVAVAVPLLFDPNDYRAQITGAAKDATGRELTLGDIKLSVFPWVAVRLADVSLGNAAGFGTEPFATVGEADVSVKLLPLLLDRRIEIGTVTLAGLSLNLMKNAEGKDNWSDLSKPDETPEEPKPEQPAGESAFDLKSLNVGGIVIEDANLSYSDAQAGKSYKVEHLNLKTGALAVGNPVDLSLALAVISTAPQMRADITLDSQLDADMDNQLYKLDALKLTVKADDSQGMKADIALDGGKSAVDLKAQTVSVDGLNTQIKAAMKDLKADLALSGNLAGKLDTQVFDIAGLKLDGKAAGKSIPGGEQPFSLSGGAMNFDAKQGTMKIVGAVLQAAGLHISTDIAGEGLLGEEPKLHGPIKLQKFSPREVMTKLGIKPPETADPTVLKEMAFSADFAGGTKSATLKNMKLTMDQTTASGQVNIKDFATQAIEFAFKVDQLDADRYMAPKPAEGSVKEAPVKDGKKPDIAKIELPAKTLDDLNVQGTLDVGLLKASGIKLSNAQVKLAGGKGQVKTQTVSAKLYGGSIGLDHRFTPGAKPQYQFKTSLNTLNAAPFLKDFLGKDYVSGLANFSLNAGGNGLKVGDLLRTLNGDTGFKVENGAVKGFNLASIIRKSKAMLAGNLQYQETEPQQSDFSVFSGSAKIVNGIIKADTLSAAAPLFRLTGAGEIDLVNQTINYLAKPTIVETSKADDGKDFGELKGLTIPVKLSGSLFAPSYKVDLQEALKQKAMAKVNEKVEENKAKIQQKINDKLGEGLNKLFAPRNKAAPAPAAEPEAAPAQ